MSTFANNFFASIGMQGYRGAIEPEWAEVFFETVGLSGPVEIHGTAHRSLGTQICRVCDCRIAAGEAISATEGGDDIMLCRGCHHHVSVYSAIAHAAAHDKRRAHVRWHRSLLTNA